MKTRKTKSAAPKRQTYGFQALILPFGATAAWRLTIERASIATCPPKAPDWFRTLYDMGEQRRGLPHAKPRPLAGAVFAIRTDLDSPEACADAVSLAGDLEGDWRLVRSVLRSFNRALAAHRNGAESSAVSKPGPLFKPSEKRA